MDATPMFRRDHPSSEEIEAFHRDGYIAFADILSDAGREGLIREIIEGSEAHEFLSAWEKNPDGRSKVHFVRPWNNRGCWSDRLIDAPLITALLRETIGGEYHFCHSSYNIAVRGADRVPLHQDHHHWFHENPVNLAEREKKYIQVLYYPNGFAEGDRSLSVIPGSHRVSPVREATPDRLLAGEYDVEAGRSLRLVPLSLPPGSMVYLNARMFHGVDPKPLNSPHPYRIFAIDIFKEAGPPHRYTQEIPPEWMERASPERKRLFLREAYSPESWERGVAP